jgi:membrane protease YdiL (CAAX protease family)
VTDAIDSRPPSLVPDCALFLGGGALVAAVAHLGVPALMDATGVAPLVAWMLLAVPLVFAPIAAGAALILRGERRGRDWRERLRLGRPSGDDWRVGLWALLAVATGSATLFGACSLLGLSPNPPFARDVRPLGGLSASVVGVWAVYWPCNILGEEIAWRGVVLPRMEARVGERAWLLNAALWGAFHTSFGLGNLLVLLPSLLLVPYVAQRRRNTWLAVLLHVGISLPGFVALALGVV